MELLLESGNQRYYKLDFTVKRGTHGKIKRPTDLIMVSDAHTHIERLVFPVYLEEGFNLDDLREGKKCLSVDYTDIAGEMSMMIYGGNSETIREPEEYIEELREMNEGCEAI